MRIGIDICNTIADVNAELAKLLDRDPRPPLPDSVESVRALAQENQIFYVTSRPVWAERLTQSWLLRHGFPGALLVIGVPKPEAVRVLGLDAFVEDCPDEIGRLSKLCAVQVIGWPYNGSASSWTEVARSLERPRSGPLYRRR